MADKIIIFSGKQFSGKDTAAKIMLDLLPDFRRCAMGDIIKLTYGEQKGLSLEEIERNKPQYRPDLIALGNWGRSQDADYWIKKIISQTGNLMVTDVRVMHEYEVFKAAGAITVRVEADRDVRAKRGTLVSEDDLTETGLDNVKDWDFIIENNTGYEDLRTKVIEIVKKFQ